jgi:ribonucleoside-diphosphate reductase alpha chain
MVLRKSAQLKDASSVNGFSINRVKLIEKGTAPALEQVYTVTGAMLHKRPEMVADGYKVDDGIAGKVLHAKGPVKRR